jgi:hypothetical protein
MKRLLWAILGISLVLAGCSQPLEGTGGRDTGAPPLRGITSFSLAGISGEIVGTTIYVRDVPLYTAEQTVTDLKNAVPVIRYTGGTLDPDPGLPRNFVTPVSYTLVTEDGATLNYTVVVTARPLISVAEIETYLPIATSVYAGTLEEPIPLPISMVLSTVNWQGILSVIQSKGKYVALDLSACIAGADTSGGGLYGDNTFDPGAANTGEDRIVSLVLPNAAEKIKAGDDVSEAVFRYFITLKSIAAAGVIEVGDYAFGDSALTMVSLPAATTIGDYAFGACVSLSSINLPAATAIGHNAFYDCVNLSEVNLFVAKTIGDDAFYACVSLEAINLPAARTIGMNVFAACDALETVSLPVTASIGQYAFSGCITLTSVYLPAATTIGANAFADCDTLSEVSLPSVVTIGEYAFSGCDDLSSLSFPLATSIGNSAFVNCGALSSINFPKARTIGGNAFAGCNALSSVDLPVATFIGNSAFYGTALSSVSLPKATSIGDGAFRYCASLSSINLPKAITIKVWAFQGCTNLTTVDLPEATSIENEAFASCATLSSANLPKARTIGRSAFAACGALSEVSAPAATTIGPWAFYGGSALSSIYLPTVEDIGTCAFELTGTTALTVTLGTSPPTLKTAIFGQITSTKNVTVKVPSGATAGYNSDPWKTGFKGAGWDGNIGLGGLVNGNIYLVITTL